MFLVGGACLLRLAMTFGLARARFAASSRRLYSAEFTNRFMEENTPTKTFVRVAAPENIFLQCSGLVDNPALRRRCFSGSQKTKTCLNLELLLGSVLQLQVETEIVCRNCAERNDSLMKKIYKVRENFAVARESNLQCPTKCVKRQSKDSDDTKLVGASAGNPGKSSKRRSLFQAAGGLTEDDCDNPCARPKSLLRIRDSCTQTEDFRCSEESDSSRM